MNPHAATVPASALDARGRIRGRPTRLMIVDDSAVARAVLSRMISVSPEFDVVAYAASGREALDRLSATKVDIILLDVEMPGGSGLDVLPQILEAGDGAQVLIVSSNCEDGAEAAVKALALGAADTLPKPGTGAFGGRFAEVLAERLRRIAGAGRENHGAGLSNVALAALPQLRRRPNERLGCLALGASTGGLHALIEFFSILPPRIHVPILITQHLPAAFMPYFARQIETASARTTHVAHDGLTLRADEIVVAPGDAHLGLTRRGNYVSVRLHDVAASSGCMPSVDMMIVALAETYRNNGMAVIFSGMGRDGLVGSTELVERGGTVIVQDQESSAVWGMPRAVAGAGLASAILPPADLARCVTASAQVTL